MLSLHFSPREVRATESRLLRVYEAARLGLSNDALALKAGMMPEEFRKLCQLDPVVELAAMQGRADSESEMSQVVRDAALLPSNRCKSMLRNTSALSQHSNRQSNALL